MVRRQAVVLAGGLGTRMLPRTERVPKLLLEVAGRPFAAWLLERLAACGYAEAVLCIAHLGGQIRALVGDGRAFGLDVRYVDEGDRLRGTGGALALARAEGLLDDEALVTYGDSYLPFDYAAPLDALRARPELDAVMAVFHNQGRWDASNVALSPDRARVARYEKGATDPALDHVDYGATALRARALDGWPADAPFGLDAVQHALGKAQKMGAFVAAERFFEVGSEAGLADLDAHLRAPERARP
ncbi:MAG: nucleotidyltransferase family protein [Polyangiales bacterium]